MLNSTTFLKNIHLSRLTDSRRTQSLTVKPEKRPCLRVLLCFMIGPSCLLSGTQQPKKKLTPRLHYDRCLIRLNDICEAFLLRSCTLRRSPLLAFLNLYSTIFCLLSLLLGTDHCSPSAGSHLSHCTRRHDEWLEWLVPKRMFIAFKYPQLPISVL